MTKSDKSAKLDLEYSYGLQAYFFEKLKEINDKSYLPLSEETLFYSSLVMDKFGQSKNFFELKEGRFQDKILGEKLLMAMNLKGPKQRKLLKDVGDTSLFLCGYFSESLNKKIVDVKYYSDIGQLAYQNLNKVVPTVFDIPEFFKNISKTFDQVSSMMTVMHQETLGEIDSKDPMIYIFEKKYA